MVDNGGFSGGGGAFGGGGASGSYGEGPPGGAGGQGAGGQGGGGQSGGGQGGRGGQGGGPGAGGGGGPGAGGGTAGAGIKGAVGAGAARVAATAKSLELKDTGNAKVDAMGDVFNNALAPFTDAPPPEQGALGYVNQAIQGVMGLQSLGQDLMDTGFAMATAGIAAMMPALPAAFLTVPHVGMPHAHAHPPSLVPPAPPVPLPSIGPLMLAGSVGVLIMGMPAGRCGDLGLAVTCGSFSPAFDVFLGSSNTFIAGSRAARMGDMTRHCNPSSAALAVSRGAALFSAGVAAVGVAADAVGGGPVMGAVAQIAADLAAAAMSALLGKDPGIPPAFGALMLGAPTVLIGGFPCPNLPNPLDAMMHGLKCLGKAIAKSKGFGKLIKPLGLCNSPGEPINPFTGEVYNDFEDYRDPETGFVWERHYRSGWNEQAGPLGYGFRHFYQRKLTFLRKRAVYETHDNEVMALQRLDDGAFKPQDGFKLSSKDGRLFELLTDRDETLLFELQQTMPASARLVRYRNKAGIDVHLFYEQNGRLRALSEHPAAGGTVDTHLIYGADEHIEQVLRGPRGQGPLAISRYAYSGGCLVEWYDALGAVAHLRYDDAHRMVQGTDRRGYSFHWHYDAKTGRCIKSHGDDGLWGVEATYAGTTSTFTEHDGGVWTFKHYPDGVISHVIDPAGGVKQYIRDANGRIVRQLTPGGESYEWLYDAAGKHIGRLDAFGYRSPPEDAVPNPPNPLAHAGPEAPMEWLFGRPLLRREPGTNLPSAIQRLQQGLLGAAVASPAVTETSRDQLGRVVQQRSSDGSSERFQYDAEGNLTARQDANGNWSLREIASWNKIGATRSPTGAITRYRYSHRGLVTAILDGNGNHTEYVRDKLQRIEKIVINGKVRVSYMRDAHDSVTAELDADGKPLIEYETNGLGLHSTAKLADGELYTYDYDAFGNFTQASSAQHQVTLKHDRRRRTHDLRDGVGIVHEFQAGTLRSTTYLDKFAVKYGEKAGTWQIQTPDGSLHTFWLSDRATVVRQIGNGTCEATSFDSDARPTTRICWKTSNADDSVAKWHTQHRYDANGRMTETVDSDDGSTTYGYDSDGRLICQKEPNGFERHYRHDNADNLWYTPRHGHVERLPANLLSHSHVERFEYDTRACLSGRHQPDGSKTSYVYDAANQLIEVRWSNREQVWRAGYDGLGRRLWREYGNARTNFYWDGDRLAAEVGPDGKLRLYIYANEDALVPFLWLDYASRDASPASGTPFYLFCAPNGMPLRVEGGDGQVAWKAVTIDAFGEVVAAAGSVVPPRLRFAGHFEDEHTGLFYNRFRDYDPGLGRYLQPDPLAQGGGINLYAYPPNPLISVDLRGLVHIDKKGATPMEKQNGEKRPTGTAEDPEVKKQRAKELEPDPKNLVRGEDGLITRESAKAECERLLAVRRKHMDEDLANEPSPAKKKKLAEQQGPCIAVTMDRRTGETTHGHNDSRQAGKDVKKQMEAGSGKKARAEGKPPDDLHPTLEPRVNDLNSKPREQTADGRVMSNPGSHAEVQSTNAALQDREARNAKKNADPARSDEPDLPTDKDALPELTTVQQERNAPVDKPCCPNCAYITHGTHQASGVSPKAGPPPE